jgi:ABC-2 type transport system permease protein
MAVPSTDPAAATGPNGKRARVPSTLRQVFLLAGFQLRDYLRSRRFLLLFGLVAVIGAILTAVLAQFRPANLLSDAPSFYAAFWGGGVPYVIVFAGVICGGDAIAGEFQNKTGYFLMGLPIRRATVYAGKYIAAFVASFAAVVFYALLLIGNAVFYLGAGAFTGVFLGSFALATVYLLALLGATFLFSSLFKTSTYATLVVAVLFLFGFTLLQDLVTALIKVEPWMVISYANGVIGDVFLNPYPAHISTVRAGFGPRAAEMTVYNPTVPEGLAIMVGYFVLTTLLGLALFEREEFA